MSHQQLGKGQEGEKDWWPVATKTLAPLPMVAAQ